MATAKSPGEVSASQLRGLPRVRLRRTRRHQEHQTAQPQPFEHQRQANRSRNRAGHSCKSNNVFHLRLAISAANSGRLRFPARRESVSGSPDMKFIAGRVPRCEGMKAGHLAKIAEGKNVGCGTRRGIQHAMFAEKSGFAIAAGRIHAGAGRYTRASRFTHLLES